MSERVLELHELIPSPHFHHEGTRGPEPASVGSGYTPMLQILRQLSPSVMLPLLNGGRLWSGIPFLWTCSLIATTFN